MNDYEIFKLIMEDVNNKEASKKEIIKLMIEKDKELKKNKKAEMKEILANA